MTRTFNLNPTSSYDYISTFIQVSLFFKHGAEPSDAASAEVLASKFQDPGLDLEDAVSFLHSHCFFRYEML